MNREELREAWGQNMSEKADKFLSKFSDPQDLEPFYGQAVQDLTKHDLHAKSDIAHYIAALNARINMLDEECTRLEEENMMIEDDVRAKEKLYDELLFAVCTKYPDESRHQTALRYIQEAEQRGSNEPAQEAKS